MTGTRHHLAPVALATISVALASCSGGTTGPASYTIGGTVTGLAAQGLVLQDNGGDDLAISANGPFTFSTRLADAAAYAVSVRTHPAGHICTVANGSGTVAGANVTDVAIGCAAGRTLTASDGTYRAYFGRSVATSSDGAVVVVGADGDRAGAGAGAAYVYRWNGSTWDEAKLTAADAAPSDWLGTAVATSADGGLVVVGAPGDVAGQGSARVFRWSGSSYAAETTLGASDGAAGDQFGYALALTPDGSTLVVGARYDDGATTTYQGSAYVFRWNGLSFDEVKKLTASNGGTYDDFGESVAVSADGNTVLAGAPYHDVGANGGQGAAYLYAWNGSTWTETQFMASDGNGSEFFGWAVALSADGQTVAAGAPYDSAGTVFDQGAVYVYSDRGTGWTESKVRPSDLDEYDHFGNALSISATGARLVAGAHRGGGVPLDRGAVYVYDAAGGGWSVARLLAPNGLAGDQFGYSVAVSSDGSTVVGGAPFTAVGTNGYQGIVLVFR